ncbi:MAG: pilus assembly protein, partial [Steroidobacteraceae bacterium]
RGDRSNEITPQATGLFRDRDAVLGDIVDSSPAWIGPPSKMVYSAYENPVTWQDKLYPTATMVENSGQTYQQYAAAEASRLNVVYVGANDGLLHAFSAGNFSSDGTTFNNANNTGEEVLAYMPQAVLADIHNSTNANLDYSNPQYGHNFYVDASPGVGDLYYNGAWHTWLVSGLGAGGADIFALDVTHPSQFSESNASSLVVGDWTPATLTCANVSGCGSNLGNTYGTPVIRLLHDGDWGIIFGNGLGSTSGDAGIYVMTVNPSSEAITTYYLSTGQAGKGDGIAYAAPVDMDGDHIVDYVYAGDSNGNVWRFNLTSNDPTQWHASATPIFTTPNGQPITSSVTPAFVTNPTTNQTQLMLYFGTGEKTPLTNSSATAYQTGTQSFYGVWDWNLSAWNAHNLTQFSSLTPAAMMSASGTSTDTLSLTNLQQQTVSVDASGDRNITSTTPICWAGTLACGATGNDQFGWYINLPGSNAEYNQTTYEQVVYNPEIVGTAVVFNSTLPGIDSPLACNTGADEGWTYAIDARSGGPVSNFFINNGNTHTIGYQSNASGTDSVVTTGGTGSTPVEYYLVYQTNTGQHNIQQISVQGTPIGLPETWIELR